MSTCWTLWGLRSWVPRRYNCHQQCDCCCPESAAGRKVNLSTYRYKDEIEPQGPRRLGFLAEDLPADVLSEAHDGVDLYSLLAYSIGAIKAQEDEIQAQRAEVDSLREQLRRMSDEHTH